MNVILMFTAAHSILPLSFALVHLLLVHPLLLYCESHLTQTFSVADKHHRRQTKMPVKGYPDWVRVQGKSLGIFMPFCVLLPSLTTCNR